MDKIASPKELQAQITELLVYSQGAAPSREKIASDLRDLAARVTRSSDGSTLREQADWLKAVKDFEDAGNWLWEVWERVRFPVLLGKEHYPFTEPFDEVMRGINNWRRFQEHELNDRKHVL
jgi:hypothetical protein